MVINLTDENFNIKKDIWLISFWAAWCGPCLDIKHLEEFSKSNPNIHVARVNVDENPELKFKNSILVLPTYIFFKKGKEIKRLIGIQSDKSLQEIISSFP